LTYKLSQDHLELFFSAIRSKGGSNNNPNGLQLRNILRAMLSNCDFVFGLGSNVVGQDQTVLLQRKQQKCGNMSIVGQSTEAPVDSVSQQQSIRHGPVASLSPFVDGVVEYVAGFVAKKLLQEEHCTQCRDSLVSQQNIRTQEFPAMCASLLLIKDMGGLHKPSSSVFKVVRNVESVLRSNCDIFNVSSSQVLNMCLIENQVLRLTDSSCCFRELDVHFRETMSLQGSIVSSHFTDLIRKLCRAYVYIRTQHMCRLTNEAHTRTNVGIRKKLTKAILFANQ
jgi:hypothetical protein